MQYVRPIYLIISLCLLASTVISGQFYFGADLSYVNEMEDCGVIYMENEEPKDPYQIFADHECNLVRLRLWHTPSWYDNLNEGRRYSDLADVKRSIARAKEHGMDILLDFHLSDNWADPSKQVVPAAWADVVDDLPALKDSLYNYIYNTLSELNSEGLLPEMIQIGNETNKGILQSQEDNDSGWKLDWDRNSELFNAAIDAVNTFEEETGANVLKVIHIAGPEEADWALRSFIENGVTDFDVMGISYYWAWHMPTSIEQTGDIIEGLKDDFPEYKVMILETGYIWTWASNDQANNIINEVHPDYSPPSPQAQRDWLIALTQEVIDRGGSGVVYWEPAWVSSNCWTQWGRGSHQEHATFFDFNSNLHNEGGIQWISHDYENLTSTGFPDTVSMADITVYVDSSSNLLTIEYSELPVHARLYCQLIEVNGSMVEQTALGEPLSQGGSFTIEIPQLPPGIYIVSITDGSKIVAAEKVFLGKQ